MKNKVVIWGTNAQNERVLIALELKEAENRVQVYAIPEPLATEEFISKLNEEWRDNNAEIAFPEGCTLTTRDLSVTESILPEELKADRPDTITRAQTEWHFIVLSGKLHRAYQEELAELKEKVKQLSEFDNSLWTTLKGFWDKVQEQSRDRNLFRAHANDLRDGVNALFNEMKEVRSKAESQFQEASAAILEEVTEKIADIESRIEKSGNKMHIIFEELKAIQAKYRGAKLSNEHRSKMFDRIDAAFKVAKNKRFGSDANEGSALDRHQKRLQGLLEAMNRMQDSARRDESELEFQRKRVASSEGQLEAQIRQAKIKMIEERLASKQERLADMEKTKAEVERQIKSVSDRENRKNKIEAAKESAKTEIAAITHKQPEGSDAEELNVPASQSVMDALTSVLGETFEDVADTVKAVAAVVSEKAEEVIAEAKEEAKEAIEEVKEVAEEVAAVFTKDRSEAAPAEEAPDKNEEEAKEA